MLANHTVSQYFPVKLILTKMYSPGLKKKEEEKKMYSPW